MSDNEKRFTIEDIMGEFGFRLVWAVADHWVDVVAYEITYRDESGKPMFNRADWQSLPDPVASHEQAETYLTGFVKWDGCSELNQGQPHWCGASGFKKHCALLRHIYERAFQLMGREPDKPWTDDGANDPR